MMFFNNCVQLTFGYTPNIFQQIPLIWMRVDRIIGIDKDRPIPGNPCSEQRGVDEVPIGDSRSDGILFGKDLGVGFSHVGQNVTGHETCLPGRDESVKKDPDMIALGFAAFDICGDTCFIGDGRKGHGQIQIILIEVNRQCFDCVPDQQVNAIGLAAAQVITDHRLSDWLFDLVDPAGLRIIGPVDMGQADKQVSVCPDFFDRTEFCFFHFHEVPNMDFKEDLFFVFASCF